MPGSNGHSHGADRLALADAVIENTNEGVMIVDTDGTITSVNPGFSHITGYESADVVGGKPDILKSGRHDEEFYARMWAAVERDGVWKGRIWDRRKNGEIFPASLIIRAVKDSHGKLLQYVGLIVDQSPFSPDPKTQNYYDVITGLPNRVLLNDRLEFMLAHAKRNSQILAVLMIDLDRFKSTNDTLGYSAGDTILQTVAGRLTKTVREVDAVFRLGNDEYAVVLEEIAQLEDAAKVAKKIIRNVFTQPIRAPGGRHELYISASIGISIFPHDASDKETLLKNAEAAMYRAKEQGENSYEHYTPGMNPRALEVLTIEYRLHKALKNEEFLVYYQPLIELRSGAVMGAEALIRWKHPEMGMVSPGEFIPIAEENGLIIPIGGWVLDTACQHAKEWHRKGLPKIRVSVNLSARQFQQANLSTIIGDALKRAELDPKYLELEITESLGMKNAELTVRTLKELKRMGVYVAIDDFGTGYSSLNYLKRFPLDTLKVDQSFVRDISTDPDDETIVAIIIQMAHTLKLKVLAEGVENASQLSFLRRFGCDRVQGYLFSPPIPVDQFEDLLRKTKGRFL
ncbi:MAG: EAL domain-containing protein [Chitinivibrionales bacterium]|nr:EAL domain-containing protein [Chitinivibrionales bacterium]MBD3394407.1 EAL domain-containing protein [Chitinivibrionales bacterium]